MVTGSLVVHDPLVWFTGRAVEGTWAGDTGRKAGTPWMTIWWMGFSDDPTQIGRYFSWTWSNSDHVGSSRAFPLVMLYKEDDPYDRQANQVVLEL